MGEPTLVIRTRPTLVARVGDAAELVTGAGHVCVRTRGEALWCDGPTAGASSSVPIHGVALPGGPAPVAWAALLASGGAFTCAVEGRSMRCWGLLDFGYPDDHEVCGWSPSSRLKTMVPWDWGHEGHFLGVEERALPHDIVALAASAGAACALDEVGTVRCVIGSRRTGEPEPAFEAVFPGATDLVVVGSRVCALVQDRVRCAPLGLRSAEREAEIARGVSAMVAGGSGVCLRQAEGWVCRQVFGTFETDGCALRAALWGGRY